MIQGLTDAMQDYLREIYKLRLEGGAATTSAIAERMGVRPPSVTAMLKRLAALGLVEHTPYHGVELTQSGERVALEVIRHHRLLEQYLSQALELVPGKKVRLRRVEPFGGPVVLRVGTAEHAISRELAEGIGVA